LKPLYSAINKTLKNIDAQSVAQTRNIIIKASEEIEILKQFASLPPLYGVGGTGLGGYEPLPLVEPPYLPPPKEGQSQFTLVLDLDETLVHYFEVRVRFLTRVDRNRGQLFGKAWLRQVPQRHERDLRSGHFHSCHAGCKLSFCLMSSTPTGSWTRSTRKNAFLTGFTDSTLCLTDLYSSRISAGSAETFPKLSLLITWLKTSSCSQTTASLSRVGSTT